MIFNSVDWPWWDARFLFLDLGPYPMVSAHRGGPYPGFPENAIETFENVNQKHLRPLFERTSQWTKDGVLVLSMMTTWMRTTLVKGKSPVEVDVRKYIQGLFLEDETGNLDWFHSSNI